MVAPPDFDLIASGGDSVVWRSSSESGCRGSEASEEMEGKGGRGGGGLARLEDTHLHDNVGSVRPGVHLFE